MVAPGQPPGVRKKTSFWLAAARGREGCRRLTAIVPGDSDPGFRKHGTFALSLCKDDSEATRALIALARKDESAKVRSQALFWLAQSAGRKVSDTIDDAIRNDPDTEVKKQAVFAFSQMPEGEGVPELIRVAKTNRNPEVRERAVFWLGQSRDPRALDFIEKVLTSP
jgi:HEAT repeat protein